MSGGFRFKINLGKAPEASGTPRLGSDTPATPSSEAPREVRPSHDFAPASQAPEAPSAPDRAPLAGTPPSTGFRFKIKVPGSSGDDLSPQPRPSRQPKLAARTKSLLGGPAASPSSNGRPTPKRIKLPAALGSAMGTPAARTPAGAGRLGTPVGASRMSTPGSTTIRLATRPTLLGSQPLAGTPAATPRPLAAALATPGSPTHRTPGTLPIVRFTVPSTGKLAAERVPSATPATAPALLARPRRGRPPGSRNKRRHSSDDEDDVDYAAGAGGGLASAPSRTFNLRSAAAPSSGGSLGGGGRSSPSGSLALSVGRATTSARTGGPDAADDSTAVSARSGPPLSPPDPGAPRREALEKILNRIQKKDTHNIFAEPVTDDMVGRGWCVWEWEWVGQGGGRCFFFFGEVLVS